MNIIEEKTLDNGFIVSFIREREYYNYKNEYINSFQFLVYENKTKKDDEEVFINFLLVSEDEEIKYIDGNEKSTRKDFEFFYDFIWDNFSFYDIIEIEQSINELQTSILILQEKIYKFMQEEIISIRDFAFPEKESYKTLENALLIIDEPLLNEILFANKFHSKDFTEEEQKKYPEYEDWLYNCFTNNEFVVNQAIDIANNKIDKLNSELEKIVRGEK